MNYFIKIVSLIGILAMSQIAYSAPGGGAGGGRDAAPGKAGDNFSGYSPGFSADGDTKNAVVLSQDLGGGNTRYQVISYYENSTETIQIDGFQVVRPYMVNSVDVNTDSTGTLVSLCNYIEAPDTIDFINYNLEESYYDLSGLPEITKIVFSDNLRESWVCGGGAAQICEGTDTLNSTGAIQFSYFGSRIQALRDSITVNGMTFNDVKLRTRVGSNNHRTRVYAKGIGKIKEVRDFGTRQIIYYYANGATEGSLSGTPFDSGQPLEGVFF
jgi:hypothetical protein